MPNLVDIQTRFEEAKSKLYMNALNVKVNNPLIQTNSRINTAESILESIQSLETKKKTFLETIFVTDRTMKVTELTGLLNEAVLDVEACARCLCPSCALIKDTCPCSDCKTLAKNAFVQMCQNDTPDLDTLDHSIRNSQRQGKSGRIYQF